MPAILALDTATDACSVALARDGVVDSRFEVVPRQHSQRLFTMLEEVVPRGNPADHGIDVLAFNRGPGSFTGLRIACSAVQGLAYSSGLPIAAESTLACMAQGAWRRGHADPEQQVLVLLDARINELYFGLYALRDGCAEAQVPDGVCAPAALPADLGVASGELLAIGNGLEALEEFPAALRERIGAMHVQSLPDSVDLVSLAAARAARGELFGATEALPVYLREEIGWKKLSEQGKPGNG